MEKKKYIKPSLEIININSKDIISTSNFGNEPPHTEDIEDW